ncbi:MAG: hypothetical protein LBL23_03200, partial [Coriobacteriales bacterium]|nr:hypothetical protein [Coriobacteriales bacterium]
MKDSQHSRTRAYVGTHARVATKVEEPRGEEPKGVARRMIACLCSLMLVVALIPATALTQAFAAEGDVTIAVANGQSVSGHELSPSSKQPINLNDIFVAQVEGDGGPTDLTDLDADDGAFTFTITTSLTSGDENLIKIEGGVLKLLGKPAGDYSSGLAISVTWNGTGDYSDKTGIIFSSGITVASGDFGSDKEYTITGFTAATPLTLGGVENPTGQVTLSTNSAPVPTVTNYIGETVTTFTDTAAYAVSFEAVDASNSALEITGGTTLQVKSTSQTYIGTAASFQVKASYTGALLSNATLGSSLTEGAVAYVLVALAPGLTNSTVDSIVTLGNVGTANASVDHVAQGNDGVWYVDSSKSFTVPLEIKDALLYSTFSKIELKVDGTTVETVEGTALNTLNSNHGDSIAIELDKDALDDIGTNGPYEIKATVTTSEGAFTTTALTKLQIVDSTYNSGDNVPKITANYNDGTPAAGSNRYYTAGPSLALTVTSNTLKVPIASGSVDYKLNAVGQTEITPATNSGLNLSYSATSLSSNGYYDFSDSFDDALTDIWGQKISITLAQGLPETIIVDNTYPTASMTGVTVTTSSVNTGNIKPSLLYKLFQNTDATITLTGETAGYSGIKSVKYRVIAKGDLDLDSSSTPSITVGDVEWDNSTVAISIGNSNDLKFTSVQGEEVSRRFDSITRTLEDEFVLYLLVEANNGLKTAIASDGTILDNQPPASSDWKLPVPAAYNAGVPVYKSQTNTFSIDVSDPNTSTNNPTEALGSGLRNASLTNDITPNNPFTSLPTLLADRGAAPAAGLSSTTIAGYNLNDQSFSVSLSADYNDIQLKLLAEDFAGNQTAPGALVTGGSISADSKTGITSFNVDTSAPTIVITGFDQTARNTNHYAPGLKVSFTVTDANINTALKAGENGGGIEILPVTSAGYKTDIADIATVTSVQGTSDPDGKTLYTYTLTFPSTAADADGLYDFQIKATDLVGNTSTSSFTGDFIIDGTEPVVTTTLPLPVYNSSTTGNDGTRYYGAAFEAEVTIVDDNFDPTVTGYEPTIAGTAPLGTAFGTWTQASPTRWTNTITIPASDGNNYQFTVTATDLADLSNTQANQNALDPAGANSGTFVIDTTRPAYYQVHGYTYAGD